MDVLSSVVQGSVLGPILFVIYINDLDKAIKAADEELLVSKLADDTKVGRKIIGPNDAPRLQDGINGLVKWCNDWGMRLHPAKCVVVHFGAKNPHYDYYIDGSKIKSEDTTRDLGVHISVTCDSSFHVEKITKKAHGVLSQIHRATIVRDSHTFLKMYTTFVRPILESFAPVWNPYKRCDVEEIEKVQRRALRMIGDIPGTSYRVGTKFGNKTSDHAPKIKSVNIQQMFLNSLLNSISLIENSFFNILT